MSALALFKSPGIAGKLVLWFLAVALLPLPCAGLLVTRRAARILTEELTANLAAVADSKARQVGAHVLERKRNVTTLAHNPSIVSAVKGCAAAFEKRETGSRDYVALESEFRPFLTLYQQENRYADLFLISVATLPPRKSDE